MFGFFGKRETRNTLDLLGDGDEVDLLQESEEVFGVRFEQEDVADLVNLGQLRDLIGRKLDGAPNFDPVWALLLRVVREHTRIRGSLDRETTLISED